MASQKRGRQSFQLNRPAVITHWASVAGKKESEGPLGHTFDLTSQDAYFGQKTWEQGEKQMQKLALETLAKKAGLRQQEFDLVFSGDLLNQCIGSSFTLRNMGIPHLGLYGACSTMAESLLLASMTVGGGFGDKVVAMTSSHFASSERQYRFPLGYGGQRTPTAQWTVTGSGAALVCSEGKGPRITGCTIGTVTDLGIKDANNMGAAMAPAAYATIRAHFTDMGVGPEDFDRTGRPRRRLRLRVQRRYPVRIPSGAAEHRKAEKDPFLRHRRSALPHLDSAGLANPWGMPWDRDYRRKITWTMSKPLS